MQYINNMRGIAILMIIYTHSLWVLPKTGGAVPLMDFLVGNGTIVFIYIAGYLFARTTEDFDYFPYLKNKFLTVVLPYLVISFPASLLYVFPIKTVHNWIDMGWFEGLNYVEKYLYITVMGAQLGPLWFIPMIVLFYVASPIFMLFKKSNFIFVVFAAALVVAFIAGRPDGNNNPFHSMLFYLAPYILGMIVYRYEDRLLSLDRYIGVLFAAYVVLEVLLFMMFFRPPAEASDSIELLFYIPLVLMMTVLCKRYLNHKIPVMDMFARLSFFIFFIHGYFAGLVRTLFRVLASDFSIENPLWELTLVTLMSLMITFLCLAVFVVLKYFMKDKSRYLIGA